MSRIVKLVYILVDAVQYNSLGLIWGLISVLVWPKFEK